MLGQVGRFAKTRQGMAMEGVPGGAPFIDPDPGQLHVVTAGAPPRLPPPCPRGNTTETHSAAYSRKTGKKPGGGRRAAGADVMMTATHPSSPRDAPMPLCATTGCRYSSSGRCRSHSHTERRRWYVSRPLCSASSHPAPPRPHSLHCAPDLTTALLLHTAAPSRHTELLPVFSTTGT